MPISIFDPTQQNYLNMGNIQERMSKAKSLDELSETISHFQETRSDSQIQITDRLAYLLSDLNLKRINQNEGVSASGLDWSSYVFVCIHGFPVFSGQFDSLQLPGQMISFSGLVFEEGAELLSDQQNMQRVYASDLKAEADRLRLLISSIAAQKKIVFVYHSSGNFFLSVYFHFYKKQISGRIAGMIDIAGAPLRHYISAQAIVPILMETEFEEMVENIELIHKMFMKMVSSTGFHISFKNKYQTLGFIRMIKSQFYGQLFQSTWNHPQILKLIIYGRNDTLFMSSLLNEKAIFHCYRKELEQAEADRLREKYRALYNSKKVPSNLQERFIFALESGQHSLHLQPQHLDTIKNAIQHYLALIHQ